MEKSNEELIFFFYSKIKMKPKKEKNERFSLTAFNALFLIKGTRLDEWKSINGVGELQGTASSLRFHQLCPAVNKNDDDKGRASKACERYW